MLLEFLLRGGDQFHVLVKQDRPAGCGALVDGQNMGHVIYPPRVVLVMKKRQPETPAAAE
jgi:hypothetical protein